MPTNVKWLYKTWINCLYSFLLLVSVFLSCSFSLVFHFFFWVCFFVSVRVLFSLWFFLFFWFSLCLRFFFRVFLPVRFFILLSLSSWFLCVCFWLVGSSNLRRGEVEVPFLLGDGHKSLCLVCVLSLLCALPGPVSGAVQLLLKMETWSCY
ncbi:hypothetical protein Peur_023516 [Populus x canadensis]